MKSITPGYWVAIRCLILNSLLNLTLAGGARGQFVDTQERPAKVTVRFYDYAEVPRGTWAKAAAEATRIFRQAGVETRWRDCRLAAVELQQAPACKQRRRATDLTMRILPGAVTARLPQHRRELGVAMLSTKKGTHFFHASIFFDRVEELSARRSIASEAVILGHAMAHEMGHLLLGTAEHSPAGIMHIPWSRNEMAQATQGALLFMPSQAKRIQKQVRDRMLAE